MIQGNMMQKILIGLSSGLLFLNLAACGPSQLPNKPTIARGSSGAVSQIDQNEFKQFLGKADALEGENIPERFASLLVASQLNLMSRNGTGTSLSEADEQGRCLLVVTGDEPLLEDDLSAADMELSSGGRVAFSTATQMGPASCQAFFRDAMPERFQSDFFSLQVSFFSFDF